MSHSPTRESVQATGTLVITHVLCVDCLQKNNARNSLMSSKGRGSTKPDDAFLRQAYSLLTEGIGNFLYKGEANQGMCYCNHVGQGKDLAQHTLVYRVSQLGKMTVTLVMHALRHAHSLAGIRCLVDVER